MKKLLVLLCAAALLGACAQSTQSRYTYQDVGRASLVEFGTIIAARTVSIQGRTTGLGSAGGAAAGGLAGASVGQGTGKAAAILGGVLVGAAAGALAEQAASGRNGVEYTITLQNGKTITIVQEIGKGDQIFAAGDRVMVQSTGTYQRVLSASHLPEQITRPKGVEITE